jgi:beta-phosphoglucomutase-like phosphatase (HAD superfamily)
MIKKIIFDLDGVLVDTKIIYINYLNIYINKMKIKFIY